MMFHPINVDVDLDDIQGTNSVLWGMCDRLESSADAHPLAQLLLAQEAFGLFNAYIEIPRRADADMAAGTYSDERHPMLEAYEAMGAAARNVFKRFGSRFNAAYVEPVMRCSTDARPAGSFSFGFVSPYVGNLPEHAGTSADRWDALHVTTMSDNGRPVTSVVKHWRWFKDDVYEEPFKLDVGKVFRYPELTDLVADGLPSGDNVSPFDIYLVWEIADHLLDDFLAAEQLMDDPTCSFERWAAGDAEMKMAYNVLYDLLRTFPWATQITYWDKLWEFLPDFNRVGFLSL